MTRLPRARASIRTLSSGLALVLAVLVGISMPLPAPPASAESGSGCISFTGAPYSRDFNSLATTGTSTALPAGWRVEESGDPTADFATGEVCQVTVRAAEVRDADTDDPPDTMTADYAFAFTVAAAPTIRTIGEAQGQTLDSENGATDRSPFAPAGGNGAGSETVAVKGVIYERTLARTSSGGTNRGFFLQNTGTERDADPLTSDGIFVFTGPNESIGTGAGADCVAYTPTVGDEIVIRGSVSESFFLTQLSSGLCVVEVVRVGVDLETELETFEAIPPSDPADVARYWERREGMRARVPAASIVTGPTIVFAGTADGEVRVINPSHPVAQRPDPYDRRTFRDPHPLDDLDPPPFDNGNPDRILLGSLGIKHTSNDSMATIAPAARTFDTLAAPLVGGVYFALEKYSVQVTQQPALTPGPDPSHNGAPEAPNRSQEYTVATFNVENLYDFRDDPFDGCDFAGNAGCAGVDPPFDYVPVSDADYQQRLGWLAGQVVDDLKSPDVLLIQEAEDQDICSVAGGALACGTADNADGKPDTLQELALRIRAGGGPAYDAAYDRVGADDRGIVSAFLYCTDRVQLRPARPTDPVLGSSPTVQYRGTPLPYNTEVSNPKALNAELTDDVDTSTGTDGGNVFTRAPQVGLFRIHRSSIGTGDFVDVYLISNHFSSGPDRRVGQRREQAAYNAAIFRAIRAADEGVRVVIGGDFNVYPRPDDPFPNAPTDQLEPLYAAGLNSLYDVLLAEDPDSAYSYVFDHQAQVLDQIFVSDPLRAELVQVRVAHINADWPRDFPADGPRGVSDHDPSVARFAFPAPLDVTCSATPSSIWPPNKRMVPVTVTVQAQGATAGPPTVVLTDVSVAEGTVQATTEGWQVATADSAGSVRADRAGKGNGQEYRFTYTGYPCTDGTVGAARARSALGTSGMKFTKMHGIGNDYVYVDGFAERVADPAALARQVSDRHFGVGGDGLILILPSERADVRMRMFNADGSEAEMCGNGIRCVAKYAYDHGLSQRNPMRIETGRGVLTLALDLQADVVERVTVDMDEPILELPEIPVDASSVTPTGCPREYRFSAKDGEELAGVFVSMGNPHVSIFVDDVVSIPLERIGPLVEYAPAFPRRINAHWVQVHSRSEVTMRTWERGSGITLACGTGACAVAVACILTGRTDRKVLAHLPGGDLMLEWRESDNHVYMTGPATEVFRGEWRNGQ